MNLDHLRITRYLKIDTPLPDHADIAMVFGTRFPAPAHIAAGLYHQGVARYILLTGGENRVSGFNEAEAHLAILLDHKIPTGQIIVENHSTNTLENVLFARDLLMKKFSVKNITRIIVLAKWYHCRRAIMTLTKHFPPGIRYFAYGYEPPGAPLTGWHNKPESRKRVLKEYNNIPIYLAKGDIAEICTQGKS